MDARKAALEEAASVLRAVSTSSNGGGKAVVGGGSDQADAYHKTSLTKSIAENEESPTKSSEVGKTAAPKSRSDVLAAAKRRAEERKRARQQQQQQGDNRKPAALPTATTSASSQNNSNIQQQQKHTTNATNATNQMDWFNLLGVVTNPTSGHYFDNQYYGVGASPSNSSHNYSQRASSRHGGLSSHGTPISLDHVGSDGTRAGTSTDDASVAVASLLNAAGLSDWANYANNSQQSANATFNSVANSLDEFTGWFDHYSRKYLGTVAGIDGPALTEEGDDGENGGGLTSAMGIMSKNNNSNYTHPSMMVEYEPEFGPDDVPSSQLEELPVELSELDLASVDMLMKDCGMLGMRFEDRGGGFDKMRDRSRRRDERLRKKKEENGAGNNDGEEEKKNDAMFGSSSAMGNMIDDDRDNMNDDDAPTMSTVTQTVPEIFFSPYFDLTDPSSFESLLVISDEEVAQIREKEAELHALADQKVKEAEKVALQDAKNENVVPRVPPRKVQPGGGIDTGDGGATTSGSGESETDLATGATKSGTSLTRDAKTTSTPTDGNVITLRKPETFTSHLDAIELVLLDQVRSKSERFFRETNRFSELQSLVTTSVDEVRELRTEIQSIRERCVTNVEIVPVMDDSRKDMRAISKVLEAVEDVVNCKASISSLMGAGDHLGAVEAIRLARSLLAGSPEEGDQDGDTAMSGSGAMSSSSQHSHSSQHHHLSLGKLKALSKVGEQLNEYEKLVVQNLTDELVETFLSWGTDGNIDYRAPPRISLTTDRRVNIRGVVQSLRVCGKLSGAGVAYKKKLCELISVTVRAIVTECVADAAKNPSGGATSGDGSGGTQPPVKGTIAGVASMSLEQFFDCINMLFEQVLGLLWGAFAVNKFCIDEGFILDDNATSNNASDSAQQHTPSATAAALAAAADLSEKSVSELLRLRREAHSLVSFDGMRHLWDTSLTFTHQLEKFSGRKAYGLRSTLLAQAKSFVERKHEANMSALVAALDSERWVQCNVSAERQAALTRLCSGRAAFSSRKTASGTDTITSPGPSSGREKMTDAEVEGIRYKVVWSCLLLLEMVMDDVACAAHFQTLATNVVGKVAELLRLFNTRSTHLVLGAGSIHSAARLKSINAKHLAIVTQCIALVLAILPHIRAALMAQLPAKQHALLYDLDKIKADYHEHSEKILSKLVSIIGGIVEHSLAPRISNTDFDKSASKASSSDDPDAPVDCCQFIDNVVTNTKKMHQVLLVMLPAELLRDVFSRIFAYLDHKVPSLFKAAAISPERNFSMPSSDEGKLQMIKEVEYMAKTLNSLAGTLSWDFTATKILAQELDISIDPESPKQEESESSVPKEVEEVAEKEEQVEKGEADSDDQTNENKVDAAESNTLSTTDTRVNDDDDHKPGDDEQMAPSHSAPEAEVVNSGPDETDKVEEQTASPPFEAPESEALTTEEDEAL